VFALFYYALTNYGRDFSRLALWVVFFAFIYGHLYAGAPVMYPLNKCAPCAEVLESAEPKFAWWPRDAEVAGASLGFRPYYYSIVTLTTLGYGDVRPLNTPAEILAASEAILGYVLLGMLVSMLVSNPGRRGG
jgi:hypothetical protein